MYETTSFIQIFKLIISCVLFTEKLRLVNIFSLTFNLQLMLIPFYKHVYKKA